MSFPKKQMEMMYGVFAFLTLNVLVLQVHAQTEGFISIDCGADEDSIDDKTGLFYNSDAKFIDSGENMNIPNDFPSSIYEKQLTTVRSFPKGDKNCYTLPANQGKDSKYLIRAVFMCGNVQEYNKHLPVFKLYLGVEEWDTVTFYSSYDVVYKEIIHVPETDDIYVCLVNNGSGTPFISALELRPIDNSLYNKNQSGSLVRYDRLNFGSETNDSVRFGDDAMDRIWRPFNWLNWENIKAAYSSSVLSQSQYKLPAMVMATAVKPLNLTSVEFYLGGIDSSQKFYMYFHFAEVEEVQGQLRQFTVLLNNVTIFPDPIQPKYMVSETFSTQNSLSGTQMSFAIAPTNQSALPPIINAAEIYRLKEFLQSPTEPRNLDAMKNIKSIYQVKKISWQGDPCLPTDFSWDGLNCSYDGYNAPIIISLDLSSCNLAGKMDESFSNLTSLQHLDLSNNSLNGEIPKFLSGMKSLKTLNLSWNKLSGPVPSDLLAKRDDGSLTLSYDGNPDLCDSGSCNSKKASVVAPVVGSIAGFVVLSGAFAIYLYFRRGRKNGKPAGVKIDQERDQESVSQLELQKPDPPKEEENLLEFQLEETQQEVIKQNEKLEAMNKQRLSFSEVKRITNNFGKIIGQGGSGFVYSGHLSNGTRVAVKRLSPSSHQALEQFQNEAQLLLTVHHRSLVSLLGYCDEGSNMLLMYEFMANGNLKEHLSGKIRSILSWEQRLQIAIEAAQALEYLHDGCSPSIIHRDVKAANILLNENMQAKVADFGWSRSIPFENPTHVSTTFVVGTSGYLDPEYSSTGLLTKESDTYSFGIVLLELISGRPAKMADKRGILAWFNPTLEKGQIDEIVDPRLRGDFNANSAWRAIETAMSCVNISSSERPTMSFVVIELKESLKLVGMSSSSNTEITVTRPIEPAATGPQAR